MQCEPIVDENGRPEGPERDFDLYRAVLFPNRLRRADEIRFSLSNGNWQHRVVDRGRPGKFGSSPVPVFAL